MDNTIFIKDVNGKAFLVSQADFTEAVMDQHVVLFGLDFKTILEFRKQYLLKRGPMPITAESVQQVFKDKV